MSARCRECEMDADECVCRISREAPDLGLFDLAEGERLKERGKARARASKDELLSAAREVLVSVARQNGSGRVNADDAHAGLARRFPGYEPSHLGPAAGSLFRGKEWRFSGEWEKSRRASNHARWLRVWELSPGE